MFARPGMPLLDQGLSTPPGKTLRMCPPWLTRRLYFSSVSQLVIKRRICFKISHLHNNSGAVNSRYHAMDLLQPLWDARL